MKSDTSIPVGDFLHASMAERLALIFHILRPPGLGRTHVLVRDYPF